MSERTLSQTHLVAVRGARAALLEAAQRGASADVDAALRTSVRAMQQADFSRQTIASLVAAALDAGLPVGRGTVKKARRTAQIEAWVAEAERIVGAGD